jgi:hypothetical protein
MNGFLESRLSWIGNKTGKILNPRIGILSGGMT